MGHCPLWAHSQGAVSAAPIKGEAKGKGKENKHVFSSIPHAVPICWDQPRGPDQGTTMPCHHVPVEEGGGPCRHRLARDKRGTAQPVWPTRSLKHPFFFFLPHANELPISCFHHPLSSDVPNFQDRREHARLTVSTDAGTQGSSNPCSRAGDPAQPSQNGADLSAKPSQMGQIYQPAGALLTAGCSPSRAPPSPLLWPSMDLAGISLLLIQLGEHLGHWITGTPFDSFSKCFHNTRGRQDSNQALQSLICIYLTETLPKSSQSPVHPGEHGCQFMPFPKGDLILFFGFCSRNAHKTDKNSAQN